MTHVTGARTENGCIFCVPTDARHDKKRLLLLHDDTITVFLNRFPYANGHLLITPSRHVGALRDLTPAEKAALMEACDHATAILTDEMRPQGFNIGINLGECAGAGTPDHFHIHVVPRWAGDHNFMTVLAEVRTIPEHIDATFDRLLPLFQQHLPLEHTTKP